MANALSWLILFCSLRIFLTGISSLSPECNVDCQTQCLIDCRQGHYYTAGNCLECPAGFYCPGGQKAPRKCPLGTANELTAQVDITACQVCPKGYLSLENGAGCRACPDGYSCDPRSGVQRSCSPGQYSPEGESECLECPENYACPDGRSRQHCLAGQEPNPSHTHCVTYTPGSFSAEDTLIRQPCPAGHFCAGSFTDAPLCPAGSFKPKEGLHMPSSSSSSFLPGTGLCLKCPAGYFCPAGASHPAPCQPGTYNPLQGQDEATDCRACPAGRACTQAGLAQPDSECLPGYVCPAGSSSPHFPSNACPPGTVGDGFDLFDKSQCETCPAGYFCARGTGGKQKPPAPCPVGHYCPPGTKHAVQHKCAPGTWSNRTRLKSEEECLLCPAGWFCVGGSQVPSGMCSSGHYCPQGTWRGTQYPCPAGTYGTRLGNSRVEDCTACPAGAFCPSGTSKPVLCPVGTYRVEHGAKVAADCVPCPGGYYCPDLGTVTPRTCGAGNFSGSDAKPCPNGTYGKQKGLSSAEECSQCPAGKYCYRAGSEPSGIPHPTGDCPPGYNCPPGTGFPFSFPCTPGFFWDNSSAEGEDRCKPCPAGNYCDSPAMTEPKACPVGFYCGEGSSKPEPCPAGTYSNKKGLSGPSECNPCGHGFYCAAPGQTGPSGPCKAGFYCQGRALTALPTDGVTGDVCPAGAYCPPGSPLPIPCPPGTYSNVSGLRSLHQCLDCPPGLYCHGANTQAPSGPCEPGYYCTGGAKSALQQMVMEGHYSSAGAFKPEPCPLGSFQPDRGQSHCRDCPEGTFCNETGLAEAQPCPKGHFCLGGSSLPLPCPVGMYADVLGAGSCKPCPAGMYCSMAGLAEPEGPCQPGYYCNQGSSSSSPVGLLFGDLCQPGYYCPAGTTHPKEMACPAGTWNGRRGAQDATWCLPCAPGFFCSMSGQDAPVGLCAQGYYCTGRAKTAKPVDGVTGDICPRGHFCPAGSAAPSPCPSGEYSNATGQDKCFPCPAGFHCPKGLRRRCPPGFYCPQRTGISFYPCPPGTFNPSYGLSQAERCQQCPAGMFCEDWGLSSPSGPCWPGFFCTAGASVPNPDGATNTSTGGPCPPGHFCPAGTSIPQQCPVGTYSDRPYMWQESSCTACPSGHYCGSAALTAPSGLCSAGYYCLPGASSPSPHGVWETGGPCPVSHFCPEGASFPLACLAGTYNNLTRQAACFPCAAGYYCPENTTSYSVNPCPAGFYCPKGTRFATEFPCPRGYFNPDPMTQSLDSCLPCPPGHYCGKENLTAPSGKCDAGWFCISAAWTSQPFDLDNYTSANCLCPATATGGKCIAGFYCPEGSPEPLPCHAGFYCNASGLSVPSGECSAGFYCKGGAVLPNPTDDVTGNICPAGTYCTAGSAEPKLCPAGTFSSLPGRRTLAECQPCPSGFYCEGPGLSAPTGECWEGYYCDNQQGPVIDFTLYPCSQGFYCPQGTSRSTQYSCPAGTFGPRQKLKAVKECQSCPPGKYCEFSGLAAPTGDCAEGFWCRIGARVRNPQDRESGSPCPPGHYCPEGAPHPIKCPPGTWCGSEGSRSLQDCQPCPGGYYCNSSGQRAPTGHCSPGYYCVSRAQTPTPTDGLSGAPCPVGHFCPLGSRSPEPCPTGSYMPQTHGENCHACPEGEYCVPGAKPELCPQGYFCPKGTALPIACAAGSYNPSQRQASCLPCPQGFFCPKNSSSFLENACSAGHYCPTGTASGTQFPCPEGTYNPQNGSSLVSHCIPCERGHYCALAGQADVTGPCLAGFYCSGGSSSPTPTDGLLGNTCPKGTYCPMGTAFPQPCPPGYYSNSTGNTGIEDCLLCDAGYFCSGTGLLSPTGLCEGGFYCSGGAVSPNPPRTTVSGGPCPPGHYCVVGSSRAQPCPAGSYSPSWSMAQCLECPEGFYCEAASTNYTDCPAGHYCPRNTKFATQYPCPPGTYSEALNIWDASKCQLCPPGRVCSKPGLARPDGLCMPGWFCPPGSVSSKPMFPGNHSVDVAAPASGSFGRCQAGTFCPAGSFLPIPCTPGLYCATAELSAPSGPCEAGFYCTGGSMLPNPMDGAVGNICPRGHFCPAGSSSPSPCPRGSFLAHRGGQSAQDCQACFPGWFCSECGQSSPEGLCKEGWFCPEGSASGQHSDYLCHVGHYCPTGSPEPIPCPSGKYQDQAGKSQCETCPAGMFCALEDHPSNLHNYSHGVIKPVVCPAGYYCPPGTKAGNQYPCPAGTYSNKTGLRNPRECLPCPGGMFCASAGLVSPSGPCLPGYYCTSKAHVPNPANDATGGLCPAGHYCPAGSNEPWPCPTGKFLPQSGMVYQNACLPCPGGKFCQGEGLMSVSGSCSAGYFCDVESTRPDHKQCPPGFYCPEGSESPVPCSPGHFNSERGKWKSADCQLCPAGYFCSGSGTHTPELCPAGYFCLAGTNFSTEHPCPKGTFGPRTGATSDSDCEPCPAGMYCSAPGLSQPSGFCYSGYHCAKGAISPTPFKHRVEFAGLALPGNDICPAGHFCPNGTGNPMPCPPGSFSAARGLQAEEQCQPCPAGRYCSRAGLFDLAQTSLCNAGYVCLEGSSAPCPSDGVHGYRCPSGFYCPAGTGLELPCEPGTFSPMPGASACLPCPAGMTCSHAATAEPLSCPRGYYCPARTAAPMPCPEGTLNTMEGALAPTACKLCPVGRYCRGDANWEPDGLCAAGYYCEGGATDAVPRGTPAFPLSGPCPLGHYCPEGTPFPVACPAGTLNNSTGGTSLESCVPCYPGSFCAGVGLSSPTGPCTEGFYCPANFSSFSPTAFICPKGHFCQSGAAHPTPCPAGQYQPAKGSASCIPCQRGFYCQELVAGDPRSCPPHAYCPTGTQFPQTCPEGTFTPPNMTGLWNEKQCLPCLPGHYCRHGQLVGKCAAGYFCLAGSSQATPQGPGFSWRFPSGCQWGQACAGLCPAGFYCLEGSELPIPCPANTIRDVPGAGQREDCLPCPPGHWCKAGDSEAYLCPSGHYCFGGNGSDQDSLAPQKCPPHTYRKQPGAQSLTDCQPCPPGYHCPVSGLTSFEDYPCPLGYWCPGKGDAFFCPPGTSRVQPGAKSLEECDPCSPGYYCPDPAQTGLPNTQGVPCEPGYECPAGSVNPKPCRPGSYCGARTAVPSMCPAGYYCPEGSSTYNSPEQLCVFPYYCPLGSARPLPCEGGYMALSSPGPRDSFEKFCRICDAGSYRNDSFISAPCQPCPAGFICPQGSETYHKKPCPIGYYCPSLTSAPLPCPPGTRGSSNLAKHIEDCQACPAGTFNHLPAQASCFPCGSSSSSQPGATSCTCHGLNRAFQHSDASCICQAGYVYYDERGKESSDSNSDQDCQPQVDELCAPGEVRLAATRRCVFPEQYDCSPSCGPAGGEVNAELGICHCKQYISAEELCDQTCLLRAPRISLGFGIKRELLLRMDEEVREVTNVLGPDEHVQKSQRVHLVLFNPSGVLGFVVSSMDVLDAFLTGGFSSDELVQKGHQVQRAFFKDIHALPLVPNPVVCLEAGDTILFQLSINYHNRASSHYPVYQKQHLYNSNPSWDYGPFRRLDHLIQETHLNISWFAHVFLESGTYVFRDRTIQEHFLIVTVNEANVGCDPRDVSFQPSSLFQLARHGILKQQELNIAPNWASIIAVLFVLGFLIVVLTTLAIVLQPTVPILSPLRSWKPRWRSLGEPHIPPEYVLLKDSLLYYQQLGPCGSGGDAALGEKGAVHNEEGCCAVRDLEDFSVRTLYDKLEDQNLHLASQLAKHRRDVLVFYNGISQQIQGLTDMVRALDSKGLKIFARQRICGHKSADSSRAAVGTEWCEERCSSSSFHAAWHAGALRQEAMELMKALEILLGRAQHKNVKQEVEQQGRGQDVGAVLPSLHSESKAKVVEGQDSELPEQQELFSRKGDVPSFPAHGEHSMCAIERCLRDSSSEDMRSTLIPMDLASLSPRRFVVYRFGCAVVRLLTRTCSCPALVLMLAQSVPAQSPDQALLPGPGDFYYDAINKYLYVHAAKLEDAGEFIAVLMNSMAWITAGCPSNGTIPSCFMMELNRAIVVLANAFFQVSWGTADKDPSDGRLSDGFDIQTVVNELLHIRVSPHPRVKEKALDERLSRLQKYQCLRLREGSLDRMENSQKNDWNSDSPAVKLKVTQLEESLDELNEAFVELTVQAMSLQEDGDLLEEELRMQDESLVTASNKEARGAQRNLELLDSWATKRDEATLLEIERNCIAQRIEEIEAELLHLQRPEGPRVAVLMPLLKDHCHSKVPGLRPGLNWQSGKTHKCHQVQQTNSLAFEGSIHRRPLRVPGRSLRC
ncbi:SCO-spondin-like isoform X4 [Numida meleagris]|uniref:SCO-spondin-like isoform X4 n=1 Tax=Numida meleagris TaxID=8996 RepID=UPI000B3DD017|nr:SCO-spondin-like isoform X4 [Numida meleagris]